MGFCVYNIEYSGFRTGPSALKTTWNYQKVKVEDASTSWTNPCTNCQFIIRVRKSTGDEFALGSTIKLYQEKSFINHEGAATPGTYALKFQRADFTLLKTMIGVFWTYN